MDQTLTAQEIHPAPESRPEPEPEAAAGPSLPAEEQAPDAEGPLTAQPTESVSTPDSYASAAEADREPTPEPQETASESSAQTSHQVTEEKIQRRPRQWRQRHSPCRSGLWRRR